MIRERRNKDKLASYYRKFMEEGIVDPNVHPWVADSWQRCRAMHLPHETMPKINKLSHEEIIAHQKTHEFIVKYVDGLYEQSKQHFNIHNLSMLLIDENGYVIKTTLCRSSNALSRIFRVCAFWRRMLVPPASALRASITCPFDVRSGNVD